MSSQNLQQIYLTNNLISISSIGGIIDMCGNLGNHLNHSKTVIVNPKVLS